MIEQRAAMQLDYCSINLLIIDRAQVVIDKLYSFRMWQSRLMRRGVISEQLRMLSATSKVTI